MDPGAFSAVEVLPGQRDEALSLLPLKAGLTATVRRDEISLNGGETVSLLH